MFVNDWAPVRVFLIHYLSTLVPPTKQILCLADSGNKEHLNGKKEGASYGELMNAVALLDLYLQKYYCTQLCCDLTIGNEMWKYIKNSVTDGKESQMERYVSYSLDLYFSIKEHTAHKMFWTGDKGVRPQLFFQCVSSGSRLPYHSNIIL